MSSIRGQNRYDQNRHMNYISTAPFGDSIFQYTVTQSPVYQPVGTIQSLLSLGTANGAKGYNTIGSSSFTAPAGSILRTNGKKIFPGANPCTTITVSVDAFSGTSSSTTVTQLYSQMVGVIDITTGLSGFIDPNDSMFAIYNVDKAIDYANDGGNPADVPHKGPSVYTAGNVTAAGSITAGPTNGVIALTAITGTSTPATQAIPSITASETITLACSPTATSAVTINGPATPVAGAVINLIITANTNYQTTITFGSNIVTTSGNTTYVIAAAAGTRYYIITFISDGTNLVENSRSTVLSVLPTSINATGNISASGSVDAGATVIAQGNVVALYGGLAAGSTTIPVTPGVPGTLTLSGAGAGATSATVNTGNLVVPAGSISAGPSAPNVALTPITGTSTPATQAIPAITVSETVTLTCSPSATSSVAITGPATPTVGAIVNLVITATTNFQTTITFGANITATGTYVIAAAVGTRYYIITFISDGTNLKEYSRSNSLSVLPTSINVTGNFAASGAVDALAGSFGTGGVLSVGNITTSGVLIANGTAASGTGLILGATTGGASGASGSFTAIGTGPFNGTYANVPAGYLVCYIGSTAIRIPYYNP